MNFSKSYFILLYALLFNAGLLFAGEEKKSEDPILFTFGEYSVPVSAFEYVYNKNNINDNNSYSRESLEEYLELYINFRLKVKEAEQLGLDTVKSINDELETYRKQLAKSYLHDREVSEKLLKEAYDRMQYEVRASHILFEIEDDGLPEDTLKAYKMALTVRKRILRGEKFETLAKQFSSDPSVQQNDGDIGYFTALQTVYAFESAAYNTPVGKISNPVRTRFGYHLVKVTDKRPAQGKIKTAHILVKVALDASPAQEEAAQAKVDKILNRLDEGEKFEDLAKILSEDKLSSKKGGELPEFGTGKMVPEFETAAFQLEKDGDISEPVRTEFGWHIIKRISVTKNPSYDKIKGELKKRVERDSRSAKAIGILVDRIKKEYKFKEYAKNKQKLYDQIGADLLKGRFVMQDKTGLNKTLFVLADSTYLQSDFIHYLELKAKKRRNLSAYQVFNGYYDNFVQQVCLGYEETQLTRKYPDFKNLMKEYHDGILLFELTDKKVWSKAIKDTVGLKEFHKNHKMNYMWETRAEVDIYTAKDEKIAKKAKKLASKGKQKDEILLKINTEEFPDNLTIESGLYEVGQNDLVDSKNWITGASDNITNGDSTITFIFFKKIIKPEPKSLNDAKGFIVSDYQEYLEKRWIEELRTKYPVKVNTEVFESLIK